MSTAAMIWAWSPENLKPMERLLLLALADRLNSKDGRCFPSVSTLSLQTGMNRKTVLAHLQSLSDKELIKVVRSVGSSNRYELLGFKQDSKDASSEKELSPIPLDTSAPKAEPRSKSAVEKPEIKKKKTLIKTTIPDDFSISKRVREWAKDKEYSQLEKHLENFVLSAQSRGYDYCDWDSAFMRAITDDWAKLRQPQSQGGGGGYKNSQGNDPVPVSTEAF